jgi:hypothetical protein
MLSNETAHKLRAQLNNKGQVDVYDFISYMDSYYNNKKLKDFCVMLEHSSVTKPRLADIARRIKKEMVALCKKQRPGEWIYSLWFVIVLYF